MSIAKYPLARSVDIVYDRVTRLVSTFVGQSEFSLRDVELAYGRQLVEDIRVDFGAALQELAHQGKVQLLADGRLRVTDQFPIPPRSVTATLMPSVAEELERHRQDAERMAGAYVTLYLVENGLRDYIARKLETADSNGWDARVPTDGRKKAEKNFQDDSGHLPAGSRRWEELGLRERLSFSLFDGLKNIIQSSQNWPLFAPAFVKQSSVAGRLEDLESIRNRIAHMRSLSAADHEKLEVIAKDTLDALRGAPESNQPGYVAPLAG